MITVSNTSPLCYLALIDHLDVLPALYGRIVVPNAVRIELLDDEAPPGVRAIVSPPLEWLDILDVVVHPDPMLDRLQDGEREAIWLAQSVQADQIILDDKAARAMARQRGLNVTGLLGVLEVAADRGLIDFAEAIARLQRTTFRASDVLLRSLLERRQGDT